MARFRIQSSVPPCGKFFFEFDGEYVESGNRAELCELARGLYRKRGRVPPVDIFGVVMEHMCRTLPDGFCTEPSGPPLLDVAKVKSNTAAMFGSRIANPVVVRERLHVCMACPMNDRASCPSCSGLLEWALAGMGGRTRIPADDFVYVCRPALAFASALATVDNPGPAPDGCPDSCWRRNL
jgi:hypothetical protein